MHTKGNSNQEKFIHFLSQQSMGSSFVFHTEKYRKGGATREPCDVVWATNSCIILMAMTHSTESKEKMFDHNFKQLKGWMRAWKRGEVLRGNSTNKRYEIAYDDYKYKILISVVQGKEATAEYHEGLRRKMKKEGYEISACVTIPENTIRYWAEHFGSTVDLLKYILYLRNVKLALSDTKSLWAIMSQHRAEVLLSAPKTDFDEYENDLYAKEFQDFVNVLRSSYEQEELFENQKENVYLAHEILSDLPWNFLTVLALQFSHIKKSIIQSVVNQLQLQTYLSPFILPPYHIFLSALPLTNCDILGERHREIIMQHESKTPELTTVVITVLFYGSELNFRHIIAVIHKNPMSFTEHILKSWDKIPDQLSYQRIISEFLKLTKISEI